VVAVEPGVGPDLSAPTPFSIDLRFKKAGKGDSISTLVGSSAPAAIGKFLSLNGMSGPASTLQEGRSYVVPLEWDDATPRETQAGLAVLGADNLRLHALAAERAARREADLAQRGDPFGPAELYAMWTTPTSHTGSAPPPTRWVDPRLRALAGTAGWAVGLAPGFVQGGINTTKGAAEGAYFVYRLTDPYDALRSGPGQSAAQQLRDAGMRFGAAVQKRGEDPSLLRDDVRSLLSNLNTQQNPFATPMADTVLGEFRRGLGIGMNNGELLFDVASVPVGGAALRSAAGLGKVARAVDAAEAAFLARNPRIAEYFALPYDGMGHHIIGRNQKLPVFLSGGRYPRPIVESEFNKIRHVGMTNRDFYRNHYGVDDQYYGGRVKGGGGWSARELGWTRYDPLDRVNYGTSPYSKGLGGGLLVGGSISGLAEDVER
jgi:hypothetical protein